MKVLTTAGLTKLIELSKNTFLDKDNVIDVSDALATVAVTGSYNDLTNKPTINDLTTSAQQAALNSGATSTNIAQITTNTNNITTINNKIPSAATSSNQLADKAFVNSTVQTNTANFRGNWATWAAVPTSANDYPADYTGSKTPTVNDYMVVQDALDYSTTYYGWTDDFPGNPTVYTLSSTPQVDDDIYRYTSGEFVVFDQITKINSSTEFTHTDGMGGKVYATRDSTADLTVDALEGTWRFKYTGIWSTDGKSGWLPEYQVNETPMTQAQLDAINSGINSTKVGNYDTHIADTGIHVTAAQKTAWTAKQDALVSGTNIKTINNESLLGSGNIQFEDELPEQSGQSGKFLTTNGSEPSWAIVDALPSQTGHSGEFLTTDGTDASWANLATGMIPFGTSDTAAATVQKEVSIPSIIELNPGQVIVVQPTITSTVANSTLKLNNFNAYPMRYNNAAITTSTDSVVWNLNFPSLWIFDGTYWVFLAHGLDSNSTYTLNYSIDAGQYTAGTGTYAITRYSIVAQKPDMTWEKITATNANYSTGTTKAVNTSGFLLNQLRYYYTTTNYANGAKIATNYFYEKAASVDMRYSTNCGGTTDWALGDYIYLVGTLGVDGLFYLNTTKWWTNELPTTNDGKLYIRLGLALAAAGYTMSFFENRPIFYHNGTKICEYKLADNKQDTLVSGTNIKTINNNSLLGSGNLNLDSLPSQTGHSGEVLTTNGTTASWQKQYAMVIVDYTA